MQPERKPENEKLPCWRYSNSIFMISCCVSDKDVKSTQRLMKSFPGFRYRESFCCWDSARQLNWWCFVIETAKTDLVIPHEDEEEQ